MKRQVRLYNIVFPIWMMYFPLYAVVFFPILLVVWPLLLTVNFIIDSLVLQLAFVCLHTSRMLWKKCIVRVWLCGFLADIIASCIVYAGSVAENGNLLMVLDAKGELAMLPFVVLGGVLVYAFARFYALKPAGLDAKTIHRTALFLGTLTAPYTFFIPTGWFF